ncbi:hypothetical protein ACO0LC_09015 [Undibacterium sp. JH2W]|uniref:hypothetical protein n=1 Tax=Undibacterium sp. JH2W TaxID=3413037 RepID=UPI003BF36A5D
MATENKLAQFRKSYPIDFTLFDDDDQAVMVISEDTDDWGLHLTITNTSSQDINMIAGSGEVSASNYHFALQFRPGTLSRRTLELLSSAAVSKVVSTADWKLAQLANQTGTNAPVKLYFLYTGSKNTLSVGETRSIKLAGLSAAPGSGARGTQVELIPHQLQSPDSTAITGSRTQYMHVTNHSGRKNIPLHMSIIEGNRVQNGVESATITLRLTNIYKAKDVSTSTIVFRKGDDNYPATKLVLSCDTGVDAWDLGAIMGVGVPDGVERVPPPKTGETASWEFKFTKDYALEYKKSIDLMITINVSAEPGNANLYLHYDNIPGYWDGQFVCNIEKGPLLIKDGNVGIGGPPLEIEDANKQKSAAKLGVTGPVKMDFGNNGSLVFLGNNDDYPTMMVLGKYFQICSGNSGTYGGNIQKLALRTDELTVPGSMVMGSMPDKHIPTAKLEVHGDVKMDFGAGSELHFQTNDNSNPGIFVGSKLADGTQKKSNSLTIANAYVNDKRERVLLENISLNTQKLTVTGDIEVTGAIRGSGGAVIIKGATQLVGSRKLNVKETYYKNECVSILDKGIYSLGGPPLQAGAKRWYRFYIIVWDCWNGTDTNSSKGTKVEIIHKEDKTTNFVGKTEVFVPAVWGDTAGQYKGQAYSSLFEVSNTNWITDIQVKSESRTAVNAAYLYELWVEYFDVF